MVTYTWFQETPPEDKEQRTIIATWTDTVDKEERFTVAQKKLELNAASEAIVQAQQNYDNLLNKIAEIKSGLGI